MMKKQKSQGAIVIHGTKNQHPQPNPKKKKKGCGCGKKYVRYD